MSNIFERSFLSKISFASASMSAALLNQYFQSKAEFFYITEMKLDPTAYALAIGIWAIWNSINDPLAGWFMDRNVTRWGRRLPWMIAFWIPLVISFGLIWNPPVDWLGNNVLLFIWLIIILIIFDTAYTVVILAWAALFPEIYVNHRDRNVVSALRQIFSLFALIFALVLPPFFVSDNDIASYGTFGWILAGISFINLGFAFYGCKEPKKEELREEEKYSLKEGIDLLFHNKTFQAFLIANLITYFAYGQVLSMLPFYRKFILGEDETFEQVAYAGAIGITLFSLVFWVWLTSKKDPRFTFLFSATVFSVTLIPLWFIQNTTIAVLVFSLAGFGLAGLLMVVDLLLSEVIDEDFVKTGQRREGIFFGFNGFFIRLAILMQAISLALVSWLTGFDEHAEVQTDIAQSGIKIQMMLLPVLAFFIGIYVMKNYYPLHGERLKDQREALQEIIEEKNTSFYLDPIK